VLATTTTDANGNFTLPTFSCGGRFTHTYIEARGGNPGLASGTNNSAIFLAADLGFCSNLTPATYINLNEVTTVATAYALRAFVDGNNIGTSSTNIGGLSNAESAYSNLVNTATGTSPGASVPAGVSVPTSTIHSLANSLAACVNTAGPTSSACSKLFTDTGVSSTGTTANTFNIAVAIAGTPLVNGNVADIFNVAGASPPFQPALASAPSDWTLPVVYTSGNLRSPQTALAIDANGQVWVATLGGFAGTIEVLAPTGQLVETNLLNTALDSPSAIAFDQNGDLIIANDASGDSSVMKYSTSLGTVVFKNTGSQIPDPTSLAIAQSGIILAGSAYGGGGYTTLLSISDSSGTGISIINGGFNFTPVAVANNGDIVIASDPTGVYTSDNLSSGGFNATCACPGTAVDFDYNSDMYVAYKQTVVRVAPPYTQESSILLLFSPLGSGVLTSVAIDGKGIIWVGTSGAPSSLLDLSHTSYLLHTTASSVSAMAIDRSGNIWLATSSSGGLVEVVGAASPVVTPRATAVENSTLGTEP
jgi:hypothetical protein